MMAMSHLMQVEAQTNTNIMQVTVQPSAPYMDDELPPAYDRL